MDFMFCMVCDVVVVEKLLADARAPCGGQKCNWSGLGPIAKFSFQFTPAKEAYEYSMKE